MHPIGKGVRMEGDTYRQHSSLDGAFRRMRPRPCFAHRDGVTPDRHNIKVRKRIQIETIKRFSHSNAGQQTQPGST